MPELRLIQPTQLYNIINQFSHNAFVSNPYYMVLFDVRTKEDYNEEHIVLAKRLKKDNKDNFVLPYEINLECRWNVIVYDGCTTALDQSSDAIEAAKFLYANGSRKFVKILQGGYELFSRLYPFLRTQKVLYLPRELEQFSTYPLEVIPGFLYLSCRAEAINHKMHREMKITAHVNSDLDHDPIYGSCPRSDELSFNVSRDATNILPILNQACDFLKKKHFEGSRVLLISERCVSRNVAFAIAYLIKYNGMSLQNAWRHLRDVCLSMQPTWNFMQQLAQFEADCRGREEIRELTEEEFYGKRMREFRIESQIRSALPKND
ncbi:dual specificity phosphatase, catalytic domain protein, partial [Opisthorchis viverrini]